MGKIRAGKRSPRLPAAKAESKPNESALAQLRTLLQRYPNDNLDIEGLVVDFLGRSGEDLEAVFSVNHLIYTSLFTGAGSDKGVRLLKSLGDQEAQLEIAERCRVKYPAVWDVFHGRGEHGTVASVLNVVQNPGGALGHPVHCTVWHLSDVHFGSLNKLEKDPRELAFLIAQVATDYRDLTPDVVVISGDVSSRAQPSEFREFNQFCVELSTVLWNGVHPERILIVPGNHDVTWLPDGTADHMNTFRSFFGNDAVCVSPFGPSTNSFAAGKVKVTRFGIDSATIPPVAVVHYQERNIKFILLVSGYFSGNVPAALRDAMQSAVGLDEEMRELLRIDEGEVSQEYLFHIGNALASNNSHSIGIIHHNPVQYGVETCLNTLAPKLLEKLWSKGVPVLFHGHVHLSEPKSNRRPAVPGLAYPVPAPTLSSVTTAGSGRGINIHFIGPDADQWRVDTLVWNYSPSTGFLATDAVWRYRISVRSDGCIVDHLL